MKDLRPVLDDMGRALRGSRREDGWLMPCPFADRHLRRKGSSSASMFVRVDDSDFIVKCRESCDSKKLRGWLTTYGHIPRVGHSVRHKGDDEALAIWRETKNLRGTLGTSFLEAIGLDAGGMPAQIRFRPPGRFRLPMLAALVQAPSGHPLALHVVLLDRDRPKVVEPPLPARLTIGTLGRGAIRLCPPSPHVELVDDILDGLRALQAGRQPWVTLGAWRRDRIEVPLAILEAA